MSQTPVVSLDPTHNDISKALSLRHGANDRICVCAYTKNGDGRFHNQEYFVDGIDAAAQVIESNYKLPEVGAIWSNLQKLQPGATARSPETVDAYTNILIDVDRRVNKNEQGEKVNATDGERAVLLEVANKIMAFLAYGEFGWGKGVVADSGNGYHLEWATKPLDPTMGKEMYGRVLAVLRHKFESPDLNMQIDMSMKNETRVITVWGTWNRKYPHTEERPQRQTKILFSPRKLTPLSESLIDLVFLENPIPGDQPKTNTRKSGKDFPELNPDWLENYGPEHLCEWGLPFTPLNGSYEKGGETHYRLDNCITSNKSSDGFHRHHQGANARQTELILGDTLGMECFSDDCTEFGIGDWLRRLQELKGMKYPHRIFMDDAEELAEVFGAEDADAQSPPASLMGATDEAEEHVLVGNADGENVYVSVTHMDRVVPKPLEWMWDQRLLKFALNLFAGKPEKCKSLGALEIAAILSTGRDWPDGKKNALGPRTVLIMMSEDGLADVIWGRLAAAGADKSRIKAVTGVIVGEEMRKKKKKRLMALKTDLAALRSLVRKYPDAGLIIVDPISSYYGCNANKVEEVKPVLDGLKQLCEDVQIAILAVAHTNKRSDVDALQAVSGDTSVGGSFRAGWTFSEDPDKEGEFLMTNNKGNHAKDKSGLRLRPVGAVVLFPDGTEHEYPKVEWLGKTNLRAQDVQDKEKANTKDGSQDRKVSMAKSLLLMKFAQGREYKCTDLYDEAKKEGISADAMKRARRQLEKSEELDIIVEDRRATGGGYWWTVYNPDHVPDIELMDSEAM
jgi:hypothetical protein